MLLQDTLWSVVFCNQCPISSRMAREHIYNLPVWTCWLRANPQLSGPVWKILLNCSWAQASSLKAPSLQIGIQRDRESDFGKVQQDSPCMRHHGLCQVLLNLVSAPMQSSLSWSLRALGWSHSARGSRLRLRLWGRQHPARCALERFLSLTPHSVSTLCSMSSYILWCSEGKGVMMTANIQDYYMLLKKKIEVREIRKFIKNPIGLNEENTFDFCN